MARMPGTEWVGEQSPRVPMERYDIVCVHTIVGYAPAHAAHFSVRRDGHIFQSRDTAYRSAANLDGNHRVIAIENEDHGDPFPTWTGSNVPALTDAQVAANARILRWAHEEHGVPLQLCPNSRPASRGLAYHRQGIDGAFTDGYPGRVPGGETWTTSPGKVCPGRNRIAQIPTILNLAQEDDMAQYADQLDKIQKAAEAAQAAAEQATRMLARQRGRQLAQAKRIRAIIEKGHAATEADHEQLHTDLAELVDSLAKD
ncbi:peptidoglycan recognition protein family protein [Nocardioides sp. T2.26MG-1]|uniref:peptidoglycan recognition protein family protein n=1 Tax=Nocardioides sp. T2.26MG-1 TaxID=3041166 RepID=UPI0024779D6D|nr:N-acetylmuramoyl-L-alanine amidase [Nocardioides sp. T2.26MG-1]CAI9417424.1 hypothetical protein HIDPHFAB_03016 [Nocardioides sp. T2.26MG-1]